MLDVNKILAIDVETSGFNKGDDITENYQILSIGLIISDNSFREVDKLYLEVKWDGVSRWTNEAQAIHGLSKDYLNEHGIEEEEAVAQIATFILKYYDINEPIIFLGHNPRNFDIPFFKKLMSKYDLNFKIAHRVIDSFSVGFVCLGTKDSNELFSMFYERNKIHNALDDASMALGVCRKINKLVKSILDE